MVAHISEDGLKREESVSEHTEKTAHLCKEKGKRCKISNIMSFCAVVHDMGKNKKKFNEYILADEKEHKRLRGTITHASTGAKYVYDMYHGSEKKSTKILTEIISYAVAAHHGIFDCINLKQEDIFCKKITNVEDYDEAFQTAKGDYLDAYKLDEVFNKALDEFDYIQSEIIDSREKVKELFKERYKQSGEDIRVIQNKMKKLLFEYQMFFYACLQRLILSILIDSDWEATSDFMTGIDTLSKRINADTNHIFKKAEQNYDSFMTKKQASINRDALSDKEKEILDARNTLLDECKCFAQHPAGIYCLPIPTGGGKTLSGLAYALEYCKQHPETERIIYVSPYISITEQNADVFRQAIGNDEWILEHHSSVIRNDDKEDEDYRTNRFSKFDINWEEPFICTTFVLFMNALFSDKKQAIRLMHRLVNAVVIIDEVQSMPLKCVNTFNYMINFLNAVCNTNIILCTATQPTLEETECPVCYSKPKYMIGNAEKWFEKFKRVTVHVPKQNLKFSFDSLKDEIIRQMQQYRSILVVLNTKSAVRKLYDLLKEQNVNAFYLTTNLCAEHRSDKIKQIKDILEERKENIVVISTNLIEAGVDISFECVYRSMTGLDSFAQSAGRCNRNGEMNSGVVNLIELEGENIGNMEELMQNAEVSRQILYYYRLQNSNDNLLTPEWMNRYYGQLYKREGAKDQMNFPVKELDTNILQLLTVGFTAKTRTNIMNQAYRTAGKAYKVIDDNSFGIIVPYKKGKEIIESIQGTTDLMEIKKYICSSQRYTVNVRGNQIKKMEGLIQPVTDRIPNLYMIAQTGVYNDNYGITEEWEPLII